MTRGDAPTYWGAWDRWTAQRIWLVAVLFAVTFFAALIVGARAMTLTACFVDCSQTAAEVSLGQRLWLLAFTLLASTPAAVGVLRGRRRWLTAAAVLVAIGGLFLLPGADANADADGTCDAVLLCGGPPQSLAGRSRTIDN